MGPDESLARSAVRTAISTFLKSVGLPLDLRTKEEGRVAADKFYEGGHWHVFCCGGGKAPGGPFMVVSVVKLIADFYKQPSAQNHNR
eukprot:6200097-Pleurochrysis_carterae.AAC.1